VNVAIGRLLFVGVFDSVVGGGGRGRARAGLRTAYVDRTGAPYPSYCCRPDHTVTDLADLAAVLVG